MSSHHASPKEHRLPVQQLTILAICRFAEPIASTSIFPYLPEMLQSLGVSDSDIGAWAGSASAIFALSQAVMGVPWGLVADRYGRKPAILLSLVATMLTSLLWGFAPSLRLAMAARALAGAASGNVGILRTVVAELVPFRDLQPRAFSLMPLVWTTGSVLGPALGGALANPYGVPLSARSRDDGGSLLQRFPYALPNLVAAAFFLVGITTGLLFLRETLPTRQKSPDWGLRLGSRLVSVVGRGKSGIVSLVSGRRERHQVAAEDDQRTPLIKHGADDEEHHGEPKTPKSPAPRFIDVLNRQAVLNLVVYTLLALHNIGYDQLLPVYMHHPTTAPSTANTHRTPLSGAGGGGGGFGLDHHRIGLLTTCYGIAGMAVQLLLFPRLARRYGVLRILKASALGFPLAYILTPLPARLPDPRARIAALFAVLLLKCLCAVVAFPCSTILLTNSAPGPRGLAVLNGLATSTSALGRAAGPLLGGLVFSHAVRVDALALPWCMFAAIAVVAAAPVWLLVEGDGFFRDGDDDEDEDEDDDDDTPSADASALRVDRETARTAASASLAPTQQQPQPQEMNGLQKPAVPKPPSSPHDAAFAASLRADERIALERCSRSSNIPEDRAGVRPQR